MPKKYKFVCSLGFSDAFGQTLLWLILIVLTLGLAIPFFIYFFLKLIINSTEIVEIDNSANSQAESVRNDKQEVDNPLNGTLII